MVEHGTSLSKIKEILKSSKSVKKSDEILDDLFSSIKVEKSTDSDDDGDEESSAEDSEEEKRRRKKRKKEKKKKEKEKKSKKKKKQHDSDDSDGERERSKSKKRVKKEKEVGGKVEVGEGFWGEGRREESRILEKRVREEGGVMRYPPEYRDERRPVDLGREAKPFPSVSRSEYKREGWTREEYDRRGREGREREGKEGREGTRREYTREGTGREESVMSVASVASTVEGGGRKDGFWDTKWDAMELDNKLKERESKGQYHLNTKKRYHHTMGEGTPSLSPSPERLAKEAKKKKKEKEPTPDCDEVKGIKKLAAIANNEVVEKERVKEGYPAPEDDSEEARVFREKSRRKELVLTAGGELLTADGQVPNVDDIPLEAFNTNKMFKIRNLNNHSIEGANVLVQRKSKLQDPSKFAMNRAFPRNEVLGRKDVVDKIADMHRQAQANKAQPETKEDIMEELVNEIEELEKEVGSSSDSSDSEAEKKKKETVAEATKPVTMKVHGAGEDDKPEEEVAAPTIDWGDSALGHLLEKEEDKEKAESEEKKKEGKLEDGEVSDGVEDGEVASDHEKKAKKKKKKRSRSSSRSRSRTRRRSRSSRRRSYSRGESRRRSHSRGRDRDRTMRADSRGIRRSYSRGKSPSQFYGRGGGVSPESRRKDRRPSPKNRFGYSRRDFQRSRSRSRERKERREDVDRRRRREEETYERNKKRTEKLERSMINKQKLLEIAKKNAAKILKSGGDLIGFDQDRLIAMRSGGQSLDEITKFCKEISAKGMENEAKIDLLADSESSEEEFHHPFMVKDKPLPNPITMLIGGVENRETLPPAARAVAKSQRMLEFPVSSGNAHRSKEGAVGAAGPADPLGDWQPVEPKMSVTETQEMEQFHAQVEAEEQKLAKVRQGPKTADEQFREAMLGTKETEAVTKTTKLMALPDHEPDDFVKKMVPKNWTLSEADLDITTPKSTIFKDNYKLKVLSAKEEKELEILQEKLKPKTDHLGKVIEPSPADALARNALELRKQLDLHSNMPAASTRAGAPEQVAISAKPDKVFDSFKTPVVDIGTIVSTRLNAMRKLQANPNDADALANMYEAQKMMASWASSKNKPGQFVGSTGATVLSKHELNLGLQCWAKPEMFDKAKKVEGGFGEFMLKKMGWIDGEGLGKHKSGEVNPLQLDIKFDKKGLMAAEEEGRKGGRAGAVATMTACKDLAGKHPVSALTELCSKRRWGPPIFTQAFECGPPHKKQYIIKVNVNGTDYMGSVATNDKKKAKANAAMYCLQTMGLVPRDPDNPV